MRLLAITLIGAILLNGCAIVTTKKHNPEAKIGTVILTPTGSLRAKKEFADAYETRAYQLLTEAVKANLPPKYRQNIVVNNRAEQNVSFSDWFYADKVNLSGMQGLGQDTLLVDYGFITLGLTNYLDGYGNSGTLRADGAIGLIFIDSKTGNVVGRAMSQASGNWVLGDSDAFDTNGEYVAVYSQQVSSGQVDAAFQRLMNKLVGNAIRKITDSQ